VEQTPGNVCHALAQTLLIDVELLPGVGGTIILVREEDAAEAKRLIEEFKRTPQEYETEEIDVNAGPANER